MSAIFSNAETNKRLTILAISILSLIIALPGSLISGPNWPDGQRYTFNGILIHDMVRDGEVLNPYAYTVRFYSRYPATNLPYGPPFLAVLFAAAFAILGISFFAARCVIALFTALAAVTLWRLLQQRLASYKWVPTMSALLFLLNPLTFRYARDIVPELGVAFFSFLTIHFFLFYAEDRQKGFGLLAAVSLGLGYLTKQYIIPLGLALPVYVILKKKWDAIFRWETLLAAILLCLMVIPPTYLAIQSASNEFGPKLGEREGLQRLVYYPYEAVKQVPVLTLLTVGGALYAIKTKENILYFSIIWCICTYLFYTLYMTHQEPKYLYSFIPPMIILSGFGFYQILLTGQRNPFALFCVIALASIHLIQTFQVPVLSTAGYEAAGRFVANHPHGRSVLFYGRYDGSFMMGIRKKYPKENGPYVLRGDRQLSVRVSYGTAKEYVVVNSIDDILNILERYYAGHVVVEKGLRKEKDYTEYQLLQAAVTSHDRFEKIATFPLKSNWNNNVGKRLDIYRFSLDTSDTQAKTLKIPIPTYQTIEIPFQE